MPKTKAEINKRMQSVSFQPIPANTNREAKTLFNVENLYLAIGDQLDNLFGDINLDDLDAFGEKPTNALFLLAMVTLFQCAEKLPDRQAADAVRTRLDWKYALHMSLDYPGIDYTALSEFRDRLGRNSAGQAVFGRMLSRLVELGLWGCGEKNRIDVAAVLTAVDTLSRLEESLTMMSLALEALATWQPEWLRTISLPHWYERYDQSVSSQRLPNSGQELDNLAQAVRSDISYLLEAIDQDGVPDQVLLPEIKALRQMCQQELESIECKG